MSIYVPEMMQVIQGEIGEENSMANSAEQVVFSRRFRAVLVITWALFMPAPMSAVVELDASERIQTERERKPCSASKRDREHVKTSDKECARCRTGRANNCSNLGVGLGAHVRFFGVK